DEVRICCDCVGLSNSIRMIANAFAYPGNGALFGTQPNKSLDASGGSKCSDDFRFPIADCRFEFAPPQLGFYLKGMCKYESRGFVLPGCIFLVSPPPGLNRRQMRASTKVRSRY